MSNNGFHLPKERTSEMWQVMSDTVLMFTVISHLQSESLCTAYWCQQYHLQGIVTVAVKLIPTQHTELRQL